jgi:uncharacterized protein YebE (UPF0316 family)
MTFLDSETFTFIIVPVLIFFARVCDVTMGTIRIIFVSRGHKFLAPLVGFFEILIWLIAIGKIFQNLNNITCYVAYAGGFAAGNLVGIWLEEKLAMGTLIMRVITRKEGVELIKSLRSAGYGATRIAAEGSSGTVSVIYSVIKRSDLNDVVGIVKKFNPKAFYSIEDVRFVSEGVFPLGKSGYRNNIFGLGRLFRVRKGK